MEKILENTYRNINIGLVNELAIRKLEDIPCINIILDESTALAGLQTRLESFVDIIKARRDNG